MALHLCRYGYDWVGTLSKDIFEKYWILHLCRYGYDGVGKDALSLDIFYHGTEYFTTTECQRAYATHASLWSLLSIYLASYFIHQIQGKIFSLEFFSSFLVWSPVPIFVPRVRAVMLKSFYEIPEMPDLQYKNAIMSRSVERMEDVCQINILLLFLLSWVLQIFWTET